MGNRKSFLFDNVDLKSVKVTDCKRIFTHYDADGNGVLDAKEAQCFLADLFHYLSKQGVTAATSVDEFVMLALKDLDTDRDGKLSWDEIASKNLLLSPIATPSSLASRQAASTASSSSASNARGGGVSVNVEVEEDTVTKSGFLTKIGTLSKKTYFYSLFVLAEPSPASPTAGTLDMKSSLDVNSNNDDADSQEPVVAVLMYSNEPTSEEIGRVLLTLDSIVTIVSPSPLLLPPPSSSSSSTATATTTTTGFSPIMNPRSSLSSPSACSQQWHFTIQRNRYSKSFALLSAQSKVIMEEWVCALNAPIMQAQAKLRMPDSAVDNWRHLHKETVAYYVLGLRVVDFRNLKLTGPMLSLLSEVLSTNTCLQKLGLGGNNLGGAGIIDLGKMLHNNRTLTYLDLRNNTIDCVTLTHFVIHLASHNHTLKELRLDNQTPKLSEAGVVALSQLVETCSLRVLNVRGAMIDVTGARALAASLVKSTTIQTLTYEWGETFPTGQLPSPIHLRKNAAQAWSITLDALVRLNINKFTKIDITANAQIEDEHITLFTRKLRSLSTYHLRSIDFRNVTITSPDVARDLSKVLWEHRGLEIVSTIPIAELRAKSGAVHIDMSSAGVVEACLLALVLSDSSMLLKTLRFTSKLFPSTAIAVMAEALTTNHSLNTLGGIFDDEGVVAISKALTTNSVLQKLEILHPASLNTPPLVKHTGVLALIKCLETNRTLSTLELAYDPSYFLENPADTAMVAARLSQHPSLEHFNTMPLKMLRSPSFDLGSFNVIGPLEKAILLSIKELG